MVMRINALLSLLLTISVLLNVSLLRSEVDAKKEITRLDSRYDDTFSIIARQDTRINQLINEHPTTRPLSSTYQGEGKLRALQFPPILHTARARATPSTRPTTVPTTK